MTENESGFKLRTKLVKYLLYEDKNLSQLNKEDVLRELTRNTSLDTLKDVVNYLEEERR